MPIALLPILALWLCGVFMQPSERSRHLSAETVPSEKAAPSGEHDFDFLIGSWTVHNRRLKGRLEHSVEWQEFQATNVVRKVWDGRANMDEYEGAAPDGHIEGMTVRLYNSHTGEWSLYWANQASGSMESPVIGRFDHGRGTFFGVDRLHGKVIRVRFIWSEITKDSCRWEQAFSDDDGQNWETNWIMEMKRTG